MLHEHGEFLSTWWGAAWLAQLSGNCCSKVGTGLFLDPQLSKLGTIFPSPAFDDAAQAQNLKECWEARPYLPHT